MSKKTILILCLLSIFMVGCSSANTSNNSPKVNNTKNEASTENTKNSITKNKNNSENKKEDTSKNENVKEDIIALTQFEAPKDGEEIAVIVTNMGEIKVRFFPQYAPKAVENFITHAKKDYYDEIIFHRVINDFMIQGGKPQGIGISGESIWGEPFEDEFTPSLHNFRGALSMANPGIPDSNGSQFFIVQKKTATKNEFMSALQSIFNKYGEAEGKKIFEEYFNQNTLDKYSEVGGTPWLDHAHTVFGQVFEGMDVVDKIAAVEVDSSNKPKDDVIIQDIKIEKYKK